MTQAPAVTATDHSPSPGGFDNDNVQADSIGDSAREYVNRLAAVTWARCPPSSAWSSWS